MDNVKLNGLSNVQIFRKALGDQDSVATLFSGGFKCPSIVPPEGDSDYRTVSENIEIVRGDDFLAKGKTSPRSPRPLRSMWKGLNLPCCRGCGEHWAISCRLVCLEIHPQLLPSGVTPEALTESRGVRDLNCRWKSGTRNSTWWL